MRIVITGASGNIGTALLRRLGGEGHELTGVCRRRPPDSGPYAGVTWETVDLADTDTDAVTRRLRAVFTGADAVVHLAWAFQPARDVDHLERVGVGGTRAVVRAASAAGVDHLVHMSSLGAYSPGPDDRRVDETWPTNGVATLPYSRHKVAAERELDAHESAHPGNPHIARMRPGVVVQHDNASALMRYFLPSYVPSAVVRHIPLLPLDRSLVIPAVHADDLADAVARAVALRATGAFNIAADPPLTRDVIAGALKARAVHVPRAVLRAAAWLSWHAHVQPVDPGWLDLAFEVPLMDTARARRELGWAPSVPADVALSQTIAGMAEVAAMPSPPLRARRLAGDLVSLATSGAKSRRRLP